MVLQGVLCANLCGGNLLALMDSNFSVVVGAVGYDPAPS